MKKEDFRKGNIYTVKEVVSGVEYVFQWLDDRIGAYTYIKKGTHHSNGGAWANYFIGSEATKEQIELLLRNRHFKPELYNPQISYEVY